MPITKFNTDALPIFKMIRLILQYFDGWEMNGRIFPIESDHELPLKERITEFCGHEKNQELK